MGWHGRSRSGCGGRRPRATSRAVEESRTSRGGSCLRTSLSLTATSGGDSMATGGEVRAPGCRTPTGRGSSGEKPMAIDSRSTPLLLLEPAGSKRKSRTTPATSSGRLGFRETSTDDSAWTPQRPHCGHGNRERSAAAVAAVALRAGLAAGQRANRRDRVVVRIRDPDRPLSLRDADRTPADSDRLADDPSGARVDPRDRVPVQV